MDSKDITGKYGFDVVGIADGACGKIVILGLETKPDRDLDEFLGGEHYRFIGFEKHFIPRVKKFIEDVQAMGYCIDQERDSDFPIKKYAVRSGIGEQGKNTLIIHPVFDARLRFVALRTNMPIESSGTQIYEKT